MLRNKFVWILLFEKWIIHSYILYILPVLLEDPAVLAVVGVLGQDGHQHGESSEVLHVSSQESVSTRSGECGQPDRETTFIGAQYLLIGRLVRNVVTKYNLKEADNKKISSLPAKTF